MTEKMDEQISALVDDEVHGSELEKVISRLTDDPAAAERWQRYNLISDALHNNLPERVETELSRRVQEALKDEPTVLAPRRLRIPPRLRPAIKQIGGMAVGDAGGVTAGCSPCHRNAAAASGTGGRDTLSATGGGLSPCVRSPLRKLSDQPQRICGDHRDVAIQPGDGGQCRGDLASVRKW